MCDQSQEPEPLGPRQAGCEANHPEPKSSDGGPTCRGYRAWLNKKKNVQPRSIVVTYFYIIMKVLKVPRFGEHRSTGICMKIGI